MDHVSPPNRLHQHTGQPSPSQRALYTHLPPNPETQHFSQNQSAPWPENNMIPPPTFYEPIEPDIQHGPPLASYQQWVESYDQNQAQQSQMAFMQQQQQQQPAYQPRSGSTSQPQPASYDFNQSRQSFQHPPQQQPQPPVSSYSNQARYAAHQRAHSYSNDNMSYYEPYSYQGTHMGPNSALGTFSPETPSSSIQSLATVTTQQPNPLRPLAPQHHSHHASTTWADTTQPFPPQSHAAPTSGMSTSTAVKRPASVSKHTASKTASPARTPSSKRQRKFKSPVERDRLDRDRQRERERERNDREEYSDSDSDNETLGGGISVGMGGLGVTNSGRVPRLPGACTHCKKVKMKCDFPKKENTCRRCKATGHVCIVEGRKPRSIPNKREYLLAQIRQKDAIIESLLKQLHNPYTATPLSIASYRMAMSPSDENNRDILGWLDRLRSSLPASTPPNSGLISSAGMKSPNPSGLDSSVQNHRQQRNDDSDKEYPDPSTHRKITNDYGFNGGLDNEEDQDETTTAQGVEKMQSLPDENVPVGLFAAMSMDDARTQGNELQPKQPEDLVEDTLDDDVGIANKTYFLPGPATDLKIRALMIEQHSPPEILVHGLVSPSDVDALFAIFYERLNPFVSLLDPVLHSPASTFARCPFLFTAICAIASRYYTKKSEIYPIAMHFAKHAAANALIDGWKSVELCQAYILMSTYAVPARRWEEDRSWLYTGLAIRIATDLNLHQQSTHKPTNERQERETLNRTRVWMICFNLDRSTATQFGKPSTIKEDLWVIYYLSVDVDPLTESFSTMRNSKDWYKKSKYAHPYDVHLCGYTALLRIVARFHEHVFSDSDAPTGLNKNINFREVTLKYDTELNAYQEEWARRFEEATDKSSNTNSDCVFLSNNARKDPGAAFRCVLLPFLVEYSRLVMFSFGFQQAFQRGMEPGDEVFFTKCLNAAKNVIRHMIEKLTPLEYMRFAPDGHFVFASFASAFLLKMLKPEFSRFLTKPQETEVFDLIGRLIQTLSSNEIAIDERHTPKLYARFLAGLLSRHRRDGATVGRLQTSAPQKVEATLQAGPTSSSTSTFALPSHRNSYPASTGGGGSLASEAQFSHFTFDNGMNDTRMTYRPETTFTGSGPIQFGNDNDWSNLGPGSEVSDEEMLASMQAVSNPDWWRNVMMPGFSWPEAPVSPLHASETSSNSPHQFM